MKDALQRKSYLIVVLVTERFIKVVGFMYLHVPRSMSRSRGHKSVRTWIWISYQGFPVLLFAKVLGPNFCSGSFTAVSIECI